MDETTASMVPAGASPPPTTPRLGDGAELAFPVPGWDRYQYVRFLGQGGMGRVFLAYDPRLRRQVALKFVRDDHPELTHRFLSEARAQAKVNHERVCKVYEVGEVNRKFFISMQYVEGRPLGALAHELTVEQKALVLRDAALGVHEAHRAGLIHRDIKPSNIMVERGEDGVPRPYVMDFGLARDWNEGVTVTGTVLGTPHYMAPEQARGEVARLDRRADVYSLGATLYALLTGQPPIQGGNGLEVLNNLATVEPLPPRALDRDIPPDLEAITLKCLEKERSARYDSARALADDLNRFLAGEPVLARTGPGYWLRKQLRKHRFLLSAATAALLAMAVAVVWGALARHEASERERLARHFTELVERIEATTRYSALSRLHDAREDRQAIQSLHAQMEKLEAEIRQGGEQALGPGHYALGRGALALGDPEKAREHLESAWQHGFREPRVAYALALALGQLYQPQLLEVEQIRDAPELRESRLRDIERRYRDPALAYLKQSQGSAEVPSAEYVAALIAFYEGRLDDALARLDAVSSKQPWIYEAPKLRGDILVARFHKHRREENLDGAKADLEAGRKAYAAAASIAESVPAVYRGLAQLETTEMIIQVITQGDIMPAYTRSQDALMQCLAVAPDDYMCWVELARLHVNLTLYQRNMGGSEVEEVIAKAIKAAEHALALAPTRREARMALARSFLILARRRRANGPDTRELFRKAADLLESVRPNDRDLEFHRQFSNIFFWWASYEKSLGENSLGHMDRGIQELQAALAIDDRVFDIWIQLGDNYFARAENRHNPEPDRDQAQALLAYNRARSINPKQAKTYVIVGLYYLRRAQWLRNRGGDPMPDLMNALMLCRQGFTIDPKWPGLYHVMGFALQKQARETWERGGNPFPLLDQARASIDQAISAAPVQGITYNPTSLRVLGMILTQRASYLRARGEDPSLSLREAEEVLKRDLKGRPNFVNLISVHVIRAGFNVDRGRAPGPDLARAEKELRNVLTQNRNDEEAWLQLGEVQALRAKWRARSGRARAEDFEEATKSYEKAIGLEPDELEHLLRLGQHCYTWATWQKQSGGEHGLVLKRGLALADQILKIRPDWREAQDLRANLLRASQ
ncbi:serine/threonine-protein kinase [Cystobacter ferrugineus]|uniref:serine/threonine-protein kinase n=1 Tax=Cystobacter ferrugineus TaxID=83449 RepID=UPI0016511502|nr:serine/threonine-protein kinase [Cystobacter ferrugineus]